MLELGRPLFGEGGHALLLVLGGEEWRGTSGARSAAPRRGRSRRRVHRFLGDQRRRAAEARDLRRDLSASSSSSSAGTTRATRPLRSASAASIMRPVSTMSIALALPTARVRRWVPPAPGMMPMVDLRLAELRGLGGDDHVAHHRDLAAAARARSPPPPRSSACGTARTRSQPLVMKSLEIDVDDRCGPSSP